MSVAEGPVAQNEKRDGVINSDGLSSDLDSGSGSDDDLPPIVILDDDSDDDFFDRRKTFKPIASDVPVPARCPAPAQVDKAEDDSFEILPPEFIDTEVSQPKKRKRSSTRELPDWARFDPRKPRRSRSERSRTGVIEVSDDDDDPVSSKTIKGKGKAISPPPKVRSPSLTPPPQLPPEAAALIRERVEAFFRDSDEDAMRRAREESQVQGQQEVGKPGTDSGPQWRIYVKMVASDERRATGSERALTQYEQPRVVHIGPDQSLQVLANTIAHKLGKDPEDLIFARSGGRRVFLLSQTPRDIDLFDEAELFGYEKSVWLEHARKREEQLARLLDNKSRPSIPSSPVSDSPEPEAPVSDKIKVKLRGTPGEALLSSSISTTVSAILQWYASKFKLDASKLRISFDGERAQGTETLESLDVEDMDILDVEGV